MHFVVEKEKRGREDRYTSKLGHEFNSWASILRAALSVGTFPSLTCQYQREREEKWSEVNGKMMKVVVSSKEY